MIGIWIGIWISIGTVIRNRKWNKIRLMFRIEDRVGQVTQGSGYIIVMTCVWLGIRIDNRDHDKDHDKDKDMDQGSGSGYGSGYGSG
jgi:hypothetical protein